MGTEKPLDLAGYGAELALKNMEYKAADDSEVKKDGSVTSEGPAAEDLTQVRSYPTASLVQVEHLNGRALCRVNLLGFCGSQRGGRDENRREKRSLKRSCSIRKWRSLDDTKISILPTRSI